MFSRDVTKFFPLKFTKIDDLYRSIAFCMLQGCESNWHRNVTNVEKHTTIYSTVLYI